MPTVAIESTFVGDFKVGDNLVYNCDVLCSLIARNEESALNKPIILQVGSILEAALNEIIFRAKNFNREGVPDISEADRKSIEDTKIDKLNNIIDAMRKYKILDGLGGGIYDDLHRLRKFRNKVHIQEDVKGESRDEVELFSDAVRDWAIDLNLAVLRYLSDKLARPKHINGYVRPITIPTL